VLLSNMTQYVENDPEVSLSNITQYVKIT
jgi:hypothetical protein